MKRLSCCLGLVVLIAGCGETFRDQPEIALHPVKGTALAGGVVPVGARIVLHPRNASALGIVTPMGEVAEDGTFVITTYNYGDGAPEGIYDATVSWQPILNPGRSEPDYGPEKLPARYQDPKTAKIEVTIGPDVTELPPITLATR